MMGRSSSYGGDHREREREIYLGVATDLCLICGERCAGLMPWVGRRPKKLEMEIPMETHAPLDQALPRELLVLVIAHHMPQKSDVKRLSLTSRFFFSIVRSPDVVAAWLWQRHGSEAMRMAMLTDDMAVLRQLVEVQRADVNALLDGGYGLLHAASLHMRLDYVTYLLSVPGIQVNLRDNEGWTPLHVACELGRQAVVHELLQQTAVDINSRNYRGESALDLACCMNKPDIVAELLAHPGIDVNKTDGPDCMTSLHFACFRGHASVVTELLKHPDIRVNQKTVRSDGVEGKSALRCCLDVYEGDAQLACLQELLKHPGLDRGDMKAVLRQARADNRLTRFAEAITEAL